MRVRRVATAAVFGGAAGLLIGTAINGRGWVAVPVMIVVAGVSALLSSVGAVWSSATLFLLIYAARSVADALDRMPRRRQQSLVARNTQAGDAGSPADLRWHGER